MVSTFPKISIITPSYNQGQYLEDTILSVINQKYPNLEYIIIDGGSTDNSIDIIKKHEQHLSYWISEKDNGLYHALQKGFDRATGDIMAWINSDDMYQRNALFTVAAIFSAFPMLNWITGFNTYYNEEGQPFSFDNEPYEQRWSKWRMYMFKGKFIQQESVFWKRSLWDKSGGHLNVQYSLAADFELWMRFFRHEQLYSCSFILSGFRFRRENQKSNQQREEYLKQVNIIIEKEIRNNKDYADFLLCRLKLAAACLIPLIKIRERLKYKILNLPPKITFSLEKKYAMSKR